MESNITETLISKTFYQTFRKQKSILEFLKKIFKKILLDIVFTNSEV